jgi:inhibitor of KinA
MGYPRVQLFGEAALLVEVEFGAQPDLSLNSLVYRLVRALEHQPPPGLRTVVPGLVSLLVEFEPLEIDLVATQSHVEQLANRMPMSPPVSGRLRSIPTVYGGEYGPDLDEVARRLGLTSEGVVKHHSTAELTVYMLGFAPGFPYLGDLPEALALPRRKTPRERVPVGSVAIAGRQTGVYTRETPGGWHVIGRTPLALFDEERNPPSYLVPGDRVRFVPIAVEDWQRCMGIAEDW